jgi:hypothetical protein
VSDKEIDEVTEEKGESEPSSPPPWVLDGAPREVIFATLQDLAPFINDQLCGRWGHDIPRCWFWHKPLTLSCLAIRQRYEDELVQMTPSAVIQFFGYELFAYLDNTLVENEGRRPPVGHAQQKRMTLEEFMESPYFDYVWLGKSLSEPVVPAGAEGEGERDTDG